MTTKQILSIAVMLALPLTAHATGPAADFSDSEVLATEDAPYVLADINSEDGTHIASTAYVKGAYNDTIAAINKVNDSLQSRAYEIEQSVAQLGNDFERKRVEIYTTWENDNAKQQVAFVNTQ
jgi:hypothetical protein